MSKSAPNLTPRMQKALPLLAAGQPVKVAAKAAKVSPGTVHNWCSQHAGFRAALAELRAEMLAESTERLRGLASAAVDTLQAILTDPATPPRERLAAVEIVLDRGSPASAITPSDAVGAIVAVLGRLQ